MADEEVKVEEPKQEERKVQRLDVPVASSLKFVYLSGSMFNDNSPVEGWRDALTAYLASNNIWSLNPNRHQVHGSTTAEQAVDRDLADLKRSSLIVAELMDPEYHYVGTLMEIAHAKAFNIPIVIWSNLPKYLEHPWIKRHASFVAHNDEELAKALMYFLADA